MAEHPKEITFAIPSRLECVFLAGLAVRGICSSLSFRQDTAFTVELAVCEAVNNAIEHASTGDQEQPVHITLSIGDNHLSIQVTDAGSSFDQAQHLQKDETPLSGRREDIPERGRGLAIIHAVMDDVHFEERSGSKILCMKKTFD